MFTLLSITYLICRYFFGKKSPMCPSRKQRKYNVLRFYLEGCLLQQQTPSSIYCLVLMYVILKKIAATLIASEAIKVISVLKYDLHLKMQSPS
jgi:hypothetical protein